MRNMPPSHLGRRCTMRNMPPSHHGRRALCATCLPLTMGDGHLSAQHASTSPRETGTSLRSMPPYPPGRTGTSLRSMPPYLPGYTEAYTREDTYLLGYTGRHILGYTLPRVHREAYTRVYLSPRYTGRHIPGLYFSPRVYWEAYIPGLYLSPRVYREA